jgi:hypothetical protein
MLIKLFDSACLNEEGGEITGSIFGGNESRLKTDNFPRPLFFDL